jgi:hypothetical protein
LSVHRFLLPLVGLVDLHGSEICPLPSRFAIAPSPSSSPVGRDMGQDPMSVEFQEPYKDRHGSHGVEREPRPMQRLELLGRLPQEFGGMNC